MQSDEELVRAEKGGELAAFAKLVVRYETSVLSVAMAILHDVEAAQDAAQETFLTAFTQLTALRQPAAFGAWILKIARRTAIRSARRNRRYHPLSLHIDPVSGQHIESVEEERDDLLQAVLRLPHKEQVVITLKYFDELSLEAISSITGQPVGTITKQLTRARRRLRKWLGDAT